MRILWISPTPGLFNNGNTGGYGGGGWIGSLEKVFLDYLHKDKLAICFLSTTFQKKIEQDNVTYYPIYLEPLSFYKKIIRYYGGYKKFDRNLYVDSILSVIEE